MRYRPVSTLWACLALLLAFSLATGSLQPAQSRALKPAGVWGSKPVLAHLLLSPGNAQALSRELGLSQDQIKTIKKIASQEARQIELLEAQRLPPDLMGVSNDLTSARHQKDRAIPHAGYNQLVWNILRMNQQRLRETLGATSYRRLVEWIEKRWASQSPARSISSIIPATLPGLITSPEAKTYPRSFEIYATRYDAGDRKIVALPDKCLKFANGGALQCDGYSFGQNYTVAISYQGNTVFALVGEAGPWNIDDNYWCKASDPQPRRMFADLPLGVPEAQAAYFNGYNGGVDQYGRVVTSPVGIDISRALAEDLGLPSGNNKVTVSFLWTDGWDKPQPEQSSETTPRTSDARIAWTTSTPNPDGSVVHIVQPGQTLVGIATVYALPLQDLLAHNGLTMQSVIQPGDRILVKSAEATATPTASMTPTESVIPPSPTRPPSSTATPEIQPTVVEQTQSLIAKQSQADSSRTNSGLLVAITIVGLAGIALLIWGLMIQRRR